MPFYPTYQAPSTEGENWSPPVLEISGKETLEVRPIQELLPESIDLWVKMIPSWIEGRKTWMFEKGLNLSIPAEYDAGQKTLFANLKIERTGDVTYWVHKKPSPSCAIQVSEDWTQTLIFFRFDGNKIEKESKDVYDFGMAWRQGDGVAQCLRLLEEEGGTICSLEKKNLAPTLCQIIDDGGLTLDLHFEKETYGYQSAGHSFLKSNENKEVFSKITFVQKNKIEEKSPE